ncbi:hypothetical protein LIER_40633 [Lithospermum erythrorhizon]|uniref:Uncharacterized protein n=1 Tax=Lithospermum erythrorhizon TaxID=34254 RepID=A0AAV3QXB1_LITER
MPSRYTCPYLDQRDPAHWVQSPIEDMSSGNTQKSSKDAPNPSTSQPSTNINPPRQADPQVTEVNQAILGQCASTESDDREPISILPPLNSNPPESHLESPSAKGSQTGGTPIVSSIVPTVIRDSLPVLFFEENLRGFR